MQLLLSAAAVVGLSLGSFSNCLDGLFVYDDNVAVLRNPVVNGRASLGQVWWRDYWGDPLASPKSHKSWRPVTTLSFRWDYSRATSGGSAETSSSPSSRPFHGVNVALHAVCSLLGVIAARELLSPAVGDQTLAAASTVAGALFATHPAHTEAVDNIACRADVLMGCFFLLGFLGYASIVRRPCQDKASVALLLFWSLLLPVVVAMVFTVLALLSKETGIVLPLFCVCWDLATAAAATATATAAAAAASATVRRRSGSDDLLRRSMARAVALLALTVSVALWRLAQNYDRRGAEEGTLVPWWRWCWRRFWEKQQQQQGEGEGGEEVGQFFWNQNRAALHVDPIARRLSVGWVWLRYCWLVAGAPFASLCCDWSAGSVPTIDSPRDPRAAVVVGFVAALAVAILASSVALLRPILRCLRGGGVRVSDGDDDDGGGGGGGGRGGGRNLHGWRTFGLSLALALLPFLLSSNLLVPVGTILAERLLYLPVLGFTVAAAAAIDRIVQRAVGGCGAGGVSEHQQHRYWNRHRALLVLALASPVVAAYAARTRHRNEAWRGPIRLLEATVATTPTNSHSTLALVCSIGKVGFVERTHAAAARAAGLADKLDVGEPRVSYRLATVLRLTGHPVAAALLCAREEAQLTAMRSWHRHRVTALRLPSRTMSDHASAELRTARWLAVVRALPALRRARRGVVELGGGDSSGEQQPRWRGDAWPMDSPEYLEQQLGFLRRSGVLHAAAATGMPDEEAKRLEESASWGSEWAILEAAAKAMAHAVRLFPLEKDKAMEKSIADHGRELEGAAGEFLKGAAGGLGGGEEAGEEWERLVSFLHEAC